MQTTRAGPRLFRSFGMKFRPCCGAATAIQWMRGVQLFDESAGRKESLHALSLDAKGKVYAGLLEGKTIVSTCVHRVSCRSPMDDAF